MTNKQNRSLKSNSAPILNSNNRSSELLFYRDLVERVIIREVIFGHVPVGKV